jgi:hypothetical protein
VNWRMIGIYHRSKKYFFEEKIYRLLEKDTETWEDVLVAIDPGFDPLDRVCVEK